MTLVADVQTGAGGFSVDAAFAVGAGETVALVGPNGAGKTTLLRAVAGLSTLDGGRVVVGGRVVEDRRAGIRVPVEDRAIGFVFQDHALFPHLSLLDNVAFGLRARGVGRAEAAARARRRLDRVGLADRASDRPARLSGGEAQRVAVARAVAVEPTLLLLDEPFASLDVRARAEARHHLRDELAVFGGTAVVVTHDPVEAMTLASRLLVLEEGRVVQDGTPAAISERPRSAYVAELVGVNLFRGRAHGDHVILLSGAHLVIADAGHGDVLAVAHPRAVALHRHPPEGTPRNVWAGVADRVEHLGERVRVRVGGAVPLVAEVTAASARELRLADGGEVWASLKATEVTVFPV